MSFFNFLVRFRLSKKYKILNRDRTAERDDFSKIVKIVGRFRNIFCNKYFDRNIFCRVMPKLNNCRFFKYSAYFKNNWKYNSKS